MSVLRMFLQTVPESKPKGSRYARWNQNNCLDMTLMHSPPGGTGDQDQQVWAHCYAKISEGFPTACRGGEEDRLQSTV
jgi:hypothetical protein